MEKRPTGSRWRRRHRGPARDRGASPAGDLDGEAAHAGGFPRGDRRALDQPSPAPRAEAGVTATRARATDAGSRETSAARASEYSACAPSPGGVRSVVLGGLLRDRELLGVAGVEDHREE